MALTWDEKKANLKRTMDTLGEAIRLADECGFDLTHSSPYQWRLTANRHGWVYYIWPGTQHIRQDDNAKGPRLDLPQDWTLLDVVTMVAASAGVLAAKKAGVDIKGEL